MQAWKIAFLSIVVLHHNVYIALSVDYFIFE